MAIRRQSNSDYMSREMDKELEEMERRIHTLYQDADTELRRRLSDYLSQYEEDNEDMRERLENGDITQEEYERWANSRIIRSQRYERQIDALADVLVNTDVAAMALVNENLPAVIGNSYNFIASLGFRAAEEAGLSVGNFQIYNARSVQMLIRENPDILPVVDVPEDERWNRSRINREVTQAIIQGDTIPQVADRLQRVTNMDNNAAVRNARTAMTASENMGRAQASRRLRDAGVPNREVWSATMDNRTRETHLLLDGTYANEDGYFGEGILHPDHLMRFPADPNGEPQEVYNCRCRLSIQLEGIDHSQDGDLYRQFMEENYPDDYESLQARDEETGRTQRRQEAINRIPQARERVQRNLEERLRQERGLQNSSQSAILNVNSRQEATTMANTYGNEAWRMEKPIYQRQTLGGAFFWERMANHDFEVIDQNTYNKLPKYVQQAVVGLNANRTYDGIHYHIWFVDKNGEINDIDEYGWEDFIYLVREEKKNIGNLNDFEYFGGFSSGDILRRIR